MSVCIACRTGARLNGEWRATGDESVVNLAADWHGRCKGCDCQHAVGPDSRRVVPDALALAQE